MCICWINVYNYYEWATNWIYANVRFYELPGYLTTQVPFPPASMGPAHKWVSLVMSMSYFIWYMSWQCLFSTTLNWTCLSWSCNCPCFSICPQPVATQLMPKKVWCLSGKQTGAMFISLGSHGIFNIAAIERDKRSEWSSGNQSSLPTLFKSLSNARVIPTPLKCSDHLSVMMFVEMQLQNAF